MDVRRDRNCSGETRGAAARAVRTHATVGLIVLITTCGCATTKAPDLILYDGEDAAILRDDSLTLVTTPLFGAVGNQSSSVKYDIWLYAIDGIVHLGHFNAIRVSPQQYELSIITYRRTRSSPDADELSHQYRYDLLLTAQPGTEYVFRPVQPHSDDDPVDYMINVTGPIDASYIEVCHPEPVKEVVGAGNLYGADVSYTCGEGQRLPLSESPRLRPSPFEQMRGR
jgi:hypothetical protein